MNSPVATYIKRKWWKITAQFIVLIFPIIVGLCIVLESPDWISSFTVFYENNNTIYVINTVFILFVFMSLLPILINMLFYLFDSSNQINSYIGPNKSIRNFHIISMVLIIFLAVSIFVFLMGLIWSIYSNQQIINLANIIMFNSYLSIAIFSIFLLMDALAWKSGVIMHKEKINCKTAFIVKRSAMESLLFVDIPALLIVLSSIIFLSKLEDIDYFKSFLSDPRVFLKPVAVLLQNNQKEVIELFPNGIETGIIMASIIYSQILYFILKVKWDYIESRNEF